MSSVLTVTERAFDPALPGVESMCPICLDDFNAQEKIYGHEMHDCHPACLKRWLITPATKATCPICRQKLELPMYDRESQLPPFPLSDIKRIQRESVEAELRKPATQSHLRYFPQDFIPDDLIPTYLSRVHSEKNAVQERFREEARQLEVDIARRNERETQMGARIILGIGATVMLICNLYNYFKPAPSE